MPKTVISNILVMQVCWEAVPNTWPSNSIAPIAKCVVGVWNSTQSVGGWGGPMSRTFGPLLGGRAQRGQTALDGSQKGRQKWGW